MGLRKLPNVFTEQGVAMLSSVLNSRTAIEVNIQIIRVFSRVRELVLSQKDLFLKLEKLERKLSSQSKRLNKHEQEMQAVFNALKQLLHTPPATRKRIGYKIAEE